jgi:hypothetical protein
MKVNFKKRWLAIPLCVALSVGTLSSSAFAFSDMKGVHGQEKIEQLFNRGIINGIAKGLFAPHRVVTAEQAVTMIVKGLDLNLNAFLFVKKPEASDYFTNIRNDAWYSQAFITAYLNGVPIPKDIKAGTQVTREQFVNMLMNAVYSKGDYVWTLMFIDVKDADQVTEGVMTPIQHALTAKIAELDKDGNFRPQDPITRAEAAVMLHEAIRFVNEHAEQEKPPIEKPDHPEVDKTVNMSTQAISDAVQQVTLNWGEKPNGGYRLSVVGIDFADEQTAVIKYKLQYPEPDKMYAQVIVEPKATVYLGTEFKNIKLEEVR